MLVLCSDLLWLVFRFLEGDLGTLYCCSLVNNEFNHAASSLLFRKVAVSPVFRPILDLKEKSSTSISTQFSSSSTARNAAHVLELEISGFISPRPPQLNPFGSQLLAAVQSYPNLHTVTLTPKTFHPDLFGDVLHAFESRSPPLQRLRVNSSCMDEHRAPILAALGGLRELELSDPTRAILQLLPDWLSRLSNSLEALHLKDNCGSVTPGVLRSLLPHIRHIRSFALGLSYSLTDDDVFSFLGQLTRLESVHLQYYLQLRSPKNIPALPNLRSFTVKHSPVHKREDVNRLCTWIRRAITASPLETLRVTCGEDSDEWSSSGANVSFESLISHLSGKHAGTLRFLYLGPSFIGPNALRDLCRTCVNLEELSITSGINALTTFTESGSNMVMLHTVSFEIRNVKRRKVVVDTRMAADVMMKGPASLRRLRVNGVMWEGSWVSDGNSDVRWTVIKC